MGEMVDESDVLITDQLFKRSNRPANLASENQVLRDLVRQLTQPLDIFLQHFTQIAKDLCHAGTAGMSLIETSPSGAEIFRWVAWAGAYGRLEGNTQHRDFDPCGICLQRGSAQLYAYPARYFTDLQQAEPPIIVEALVVPLLSEGQALGTIWMLSHDEQQQFDLEDLRVMTSLADFLAAALASAQMHQVLTENIRREHEAETTRIRLEMAIEHKRAEVELQKNQVQLQQQLAEIEAIYQIAPIGLNVLDTDLRFVRINQRLAEMNGYPIEAHLGHTVRELLPNLADAAELILRPILETGEPRLNIEIRGETPAQPGTPRIWLEHFLPLKHGDRVIGISTVCEEITDRRRAEQALQERERQLTTLAEASPAIIFRFDAPDNCVYINRRWFEITGQSAEVALGMGWVQTLHPDDRDRLISAWLEWCANAQQRGLFQSEGRCIRPDNQVVWFFCQALAETDADGTVIGYIGVFTDVTDRKRIEAEREQLLQREQTAREAAERANRIKDEFLAILSHELRSPLNPILGWAKLLQTRKFDETRVAEALASIERNARLQTQLIDDLLDVAKILRGKLSLNITAVNLSVVIEAAIDTVSTAALGKSISLHLGLPNIGQVSGDATRLQQVIWNLLSNAIKFTPEGGQVEVKLEKVQGERAPEWMREPGNPTSIPLPIYSYAQISVTDTGKGIHPDFLPHLFESFRQEDASTTRKYGGLGLGLAIVRQLVEAHGGTIIAESPGEGLGATFTVRLPLLRDAPAIKQINKLTQQALDLRGIRVLAVDDDPDARDLLTILLTQYGAQALIVASAAEVLETLESFQPDVLVSDIGMPDMDGYTLIQQIRTLSPEKGGQIPAIALTAYAGEIDYQRAIAAGFHRHIPKPVEPDQLVAAITTLIG